MVNPFEAILFDLDDTLLYDDMEGTFIRHYFTLIAEYVQPVLDPRKFMAALLTATEAMQRNHHPTMTNEQTFVQVFEPQVGRTWAELGPFFARFYEEQFPRLSVYATPHPDARRAVQACFERGYRVVIATNPLFPARAVEHRLAWAGLAEMPFDLVTTYENMHASKPSLAYYHEIAAMLDISPTACLMVGNDVQHDITPAQAVGMRTFLADEWLVGDHAQIRPDGRGHLSDLIEWLTAA